MALFIEVCVEGAVGAFAASEGGADRVEVCRSLAVDGLTPTPDDVAVCRGLTIPFHVLVRPRADGFVLDGGDMEAMRRGVLMAKAWGAAGVVLGALRPDGAIDRESIAELAALARPLSVTFHKAFDRAADPFAALNDLIELGIDRVLTSGQAPTAREGLKTLTALVRRAAGRTIILAGGRVREADLPALAAAGVHEVHAGSAAMTDGRTDPEKVRRLVAAARAL